MSYSIVICSRNIENLTACVAALPAAGETGRVIVVWDGGEIPDIRETEIWSSDTGEMTLGVQPFCFARNANIGIRAAGTDDAVLLNDDALLEPNPPGGWTPLDFMSLCHGRGIVAATTNVTGYPLQQRRGVQGERLAFREVPFAAFVCVYIPRATIDRVGLLDERFGGPGVYGGEDVDYCLRVREAGLRVGVSDFCFVDHATLKSTFRGDHPTNGAPGDIRESNRIGIEKWGDKWPHM